jgi:hypothetical protein
MARSAGLFALGGLLACSAALAADEAAQWQRLWARLPPLPAQAAEAARAISVRRVMSEGLGFEQLRVDIGDERLRALQRDVDGLFDLTAKAHAAQVQRAMDAVNKDPQLAELGRKIDETWKPDPKQPDRMPSLEQLRALDREVTRVLGPMPSPASAAAERAARSPIAAYRLELQRATPRAGQFLQRLADLQRRHAAEHARVDRDAMSRRGPGSEGLALARGVVAQHQALAQQQLAEARTIDDEARAALAPRAQRLAELAQEAEQRGTPVPQRHEAYAAIKAYLELLLTLQRETLLDVGFWAALRPAALPHSLYESSLAPGFDLRAAGELPFSLPHYPIGRAIVLDRLPGIR